MSNSYNIWHIALGGDVYFIVGGKTEEEANHLADEMQELSFLGLLPQMFYMAVLEGCRRDRDWFEMSKENALPHPPVAYLDIYYEYVNRRKNEMSRGFETWLYDRGYSIILPDATVDQIIREEGGSHVDGSNHDYELAMTPIGLVEKCSLCGLERRCSIQSKVERMN